MRRSSIRSRRVEGRRGQCQGHSGASPHDLSEASHEQLGNIRRTRKDQTNQQQHHHPRSRYSSTRNPEARNRSQCLTQSPTASTSRASTSRECAPADTIDRNTNNPQLPARQEDTNPQLLSAQARGRRFHRGGTMVRRQARSMYV